MCPSSLTLVAITSYSSQRQVHKRKDTSFKWMILIAFTFTSAGTSVLKQHIKSAIGMIFISAEACYSFFMVSPSTLSRMQNYNVFGTLYHDRFGFFQQPTQPPLRSLQHDDNMSIYENIHWKQVSRLVGLVPLYLAIPLWEWMILF